ncbi:MAG: class I SAM-dependent methyltransferase [Candidatus Korobacteraceae bacterium]
MPPSAIASPAQVEQRRDALVERILRSATSAMEVLGLYLGDQLGLYEAMARGGPFTAAELAARTGTAERYVREWLEHQAVSGILAVEDASAPAESRRYSLPAGHAEVLADSESVNYMAPVGQLMAGLMAPLPSLLRAYRTGEGVPYAEYGKEMVDGQARMNRTAFLKQLGPEWLASIADLRQRLESQPPARIADFGCGGGWSSIGMAQAFPNVLVDGLDLDEPSIALARENAAKAGLSERVKFRVQDAASPELAGQYDLVTALECVHDMSNPVGALRAMRGLLKSGGMVFIMDERVAENFDPDAGLIEAFMYGCSVLHCLPVGLADTPSTGTGTVMRISTLERYAREAGFTRFEVLPIEHPLFRFYRLQ